MPYTSIPGSKREVGKPIDKDLVDNIHYNLEDLNTRLGSISIAAGSAILVNKVEKKAKDALPIGSIVYGSLSSAQFSAETDGGEWVAANGASVSGSDWSALTGRSNLPDVRGRFIRAKDNAAGNSPIDPALDAYTADSLKSHLHDMSHGHANSFGLTGSTTFADPGHSHTMSHEHKWGSTNASGDLDSYDSSGSVIRTLNYFSAIRDAGAVSTPYIVTPHSLSFYTKGVIGAEGYVAFGTIPLTGGNTNTATVGFTGSVTSIGANTGSTGATETAPRYVTENVFMKINRAYINTDTRLFVLRVPQQTTLNNILLSPVSQGTSGNLIIDIKKGSTIAGATQSIFQSGNLPTLAWNGASGVTGLTDSAQNTVAAGWFIVVSITSTQAKLKEFHLFCGGDY